MCGIAGLLRTGGGDTDTLSGLARRMALALAHRGPDAADTFADGEAGVAFGHRRLSIIDLSEAGAQPMHSECGRLTITYNGEIYNHLDIRKQLEDAGAAPNWRGHSDTETLLHAIRHWGVEDALRRFSGMFAFVVFDRRDRTLTLCRDRFGEKPLFYGWCGADLVFASELKAFAAHPAWAPSLDRSALTSFMRASYVPAPWSIWQDVRKLPAGSLVTFSIPAVAGDWPQPRAWWSLAQAAATQRKTWLTNERDATDELERVLSAAVQRQCLSDVPLGAFLSGGIDSSTIVALMQKQSSRPVRTFTIGFAEGAYNEAEDARRVATHLGTDHTEITVDPQTARDVIPKLPEIYDEPFADSSQIPTHLVSMLARQHVTVALSGDAGDELFGGYNRHVWGGALHRRFGHLPAPLRTALAAALSAVSPQPAGVVADLLQPLLPGRLRVRRAGDQLAKFARILKARSLDDMHTLLASIEPDPASVVIGGSERASWAASQLAAIDPKSDPLERMTLADAFGYLTDDILQKVDRAAMAVSLETRVPFLDSAVVDLAWRTPPSMKVRDGRGKWLVREVLYRHVPREMVERPKTGFSIPLDDWLRGPLKEWASDLLAPDRLRRQGLFDVNRVSAALDEHRRGHNRGYWLWNVLMAQAWHDRWVKA
jgi:asparagine synthase (glutamine-hydrolysing)